ncbi:MAG: nicotinate phosphoribosyltransferase [Burkholderiales bacterium]|jgi:nicotinate phosphoribosyltransferase|nr:nicotinate phosphoribosyltransferase [Burkholderiales bacterium]
MIIRSLLDTDLYKFTMMQVVLHHFPAAQVEYRFKCRNGEGVDLASVADEITRQVKALCELRFTSEELSYLRGLRFIKSDFVDLLGLFKLDERFIQISSGPEYENGLDITIKGPWLHTILFEIPVLAIISEVYYRHAVPSPGFSTGRARLAAKARQFEATEEGFHFADYGTRRRFSYAWQEEVLRALQQALPGKFVGTSNVHFARQLGLTPLGTMSHEYLQACQAVGPRLRDSQSYAFNTWAREYRGDLGIALSDVYGLDAFLRDFDLFFCKLFDGVRQDSGDPFEWGDKLIAHYQKMRIDPRGKTMVFSDSLTPELAIRLFHYFKDRVNISFGIGTNLTNDLGYPALQNVIKMTRCNGQSVAKISDSPTKTMDHDPKYVNYLREVFQTFEEAHALSKEDSRS